MDAAKLDSFLSRNSFIGSDRCFTSLDLECLEYVPVTDAQAHPHLTRWHVHAAFLRSSGRRPMAKGVAPAELQELLSKMSRPGPSAKAAPVVEKTSEPTLLPRPCPVTIWDGSPPTMFTAVLPFYSHTKRTCAQIQMDESLGIDRCVFSNLWTEPDDRPIRVPVAPEALGGAALMKHAFLAETFGICSESFFQAAKCELEADARFLMTLNRHDCAKYGQGRLVPNRKQTERMQAMGLELQEGLACPNKTYAGEHDMHKLRRVPPRRADWDDIRLDVMMHVCRHKFGVGCHLDVPTVASRSFAALIESRESWLLVEHPRLGGDNTWGDGGDGTGTNWLGRCLSQLLLEAGGAPMALTACSLPSSAQLKQPIDTIVEYTWP